MSAGNRFVDKYLKGRTMCDRNSAAREVIGRATTYAHQNNSSLEEALGVVFGELLNDVNQELHMQGDRLPRNGLFRSAFYRAIQKWFTRSPK